jgi:hypothetical protein
LAPCRRTGPDRRARNAGTAPETKVFLPLVRKTKEDSSFFEKKAAKKLYCFAP